MHAPYREGAGEGAIRPLHVVLQEYRWATNPRVLWAAGPFVVVILWEIWSYVSQQTPNAASTKAISFVLALMAGSILFVVHRATSNHGDVVEIREDRIYRQRDSQITEILWDEVSTLTSSLWDVKGARAEHHVLTSVRGVSMTFTESLVGVGALVSELERRVVRKALPASLLAYRAGHTVRFGEIEIDKMGISHAGSSLSWEDVRSVEAEGGALLVRSALDRTRIVARLDRVPNACLLTALIAQVRETRAASSATAAA